MHIIEDMLIYGRIDPFDGENTGKLEGGSAMKAVKPRGYGGILVLCVPAACWFAKADCVKRYAKGNSRFERPGSVVLRRADGRTGTTARRSERFARRRRKEHSCCLRTMEAAGRGHFYTMRRERQYFAGQWTLYESCISGVSLGRWICIARQGICRSFNNIKSEEKRYG